VPYCSRIASITQYMAAPVIHSRAANVHMDKDHT
jgi:hypothetical protein